MDLGPPSGPALVRLYTDDHDRLGFLYLVATDESATLGSMLDAGLLSAAALDSPTSLVFDRWAGMATMALAARQVQYGALAELDEPDS